MKIGGPAVLLIFLLSFSFIGGQSKDNATPPPPVHVKSDSLYVEEVENFSEGFIAVLIPTAVSCVGFRHYIGYKL